MGMSASQARLLSITSRLTNNEFRAQTITNSKLRLATETTQATKAYNEALDAEQLMFLNYDDNGDASKISLTHSLINEYAPMKNQYILRNPNNKVLTNNTDAKNFVKTDNLLDFLRCYDLVEGTENSIERVKSHNPDWDDWKVEHDKWKAEEPDKEGYKVEVPGKTTHVYTESQVYDAISDINCFKYVKNYKERCYMHVLNALVGFGQHTTSDGIKFNVYCADRKGTAPAEYAAWNLADLVDESLLDGGSRVTGIYDGYGYNYGWGWNTCESNEYIGDVKRDLLKSDPVSDKSCDGFIISVRDNSEVPCRGDGSDAAKYNKPLKKIGTNAETGEPITEGGYCYQKAIDILYKLGQKYGDDLSDYSDQYWPVGGFASTEELEEFYYFVEFDLGEWTEKSTEGYDEYPGYEEAVEKWKNEEPEEPQKETVVEKYVISDIIVNDQNKAQWYTNLWHILNNSDTANNVEYKQLKTTWGIDDPEYGFKVSNKDKTIEFDNFEVIDINLADSPEWLQSALEMGIVSMEQATFMNPSEDSFKDMELTSSGRTWKSIIYTDATDIVAVPDDEAVAKAQVEYKKTMKKIHAEDKKLDTDLRKLDTEHSALQAEYDSIKETISKNVERSFKMFS